MSTEKSLLTYESVKDLLKKVDTNFDGIAVPIGITPCGLLEYAQLLDGRETSNMLACGIVGSGKSKYIQFIIQSLIDLYGHDIKVQYIDGKKCEVQYWKCTERHDCRIPNHGLLVGCNTAEDLASYLRKLRVYVEHKPEKVREIVILDMIYDFLPECSTETLKDLGFILKNGPAVGVHTVWASQHLNTATGITHSEDFDLVCTTRVNEAVSSDLYGNSIGTMVRKYGDVIYSYLGNHGKLRVPFCGTGWGY